MTELEREMILAERAEKRDEMNERRERVREMKERQRLVRSAPSHPPQTNGRLQDAGLGFILLPSHPFYRRRRTRKGPAGATLSRGRRPRRRVPCGSSR